jgi:predicted small lipoprotein YifL
MMIRSLVLSTVIAILAGCGGTGPGNAPLPDAFDGVIVLPTWRLEDVQPQSPRAGQTYGVDTFSGKIVVVTLVQGF